MDQLAQDLTAAGIPVWCDISLAPGERFAEKIERMIDDCLAFVVVLSPDAVGSTWVRDEIAYAFLRKKRVFPLLLHETTVPLQLASLNYNPVAIGQPPPDDLLEQLRALAGGGPDQVVGVHPAPAPRPMPAVEAIPRPPTARFQAQTLPGHRGRVTGLAIAPNGRWLATASADKTARVWDAITGATRATLTGHKGTVTGVAVAPDGTWLAPRAPTRRYGCGTQRHGRP